MKRSPLFLATLLACLAGVLAWPEARAAAPSAGDPCVACHADLTKLLPKGHKAVKGTGYASCTSCHSTGETGNAEANAFSTQLHLTHTTLKKPLDCTSCHQIVAGKSFGLIGGTHSWGAPTEGDLSAIKEDFTSWTASPFNDNIHAKASIDCAGCHGKEVPPADATVANDRCLACHGPLDKLIDKTKNVEFPKRNPHASHLGTDVPCVSCHRGHQASAVYCADCHKTWKMEIKGSGK
ncbi:MAG: hypothetical protein F8N37_03675 [Telmatospirillum sp.]|nr:hypothetical protein [Telmatospirillum sp.]